MSRRRNNDTASLVTIAIAEDMDHARDVIQMLGASEIECIIRPRQEGDIRPGVPLAVSEDQVEQARAILMSRNSPGDFFDYSFGPGSFSDDEDLL
jgi:hypothetical protein